MVITVEPVAFELTVWNITCLVFSSTEIILVVSKVFTVILKSGGDLFI